MVDPPHHAPLPARDDDDASARLPALLVIFIGVGVVLGLLVRNGVDVPGISGDVTVIADRSLPGEDQTTVAVTTTTIATTTSASIAATPVPAGTAVTVAANQATVVLAGAVPSQAMAEELVNRAGAIYTPDQIQNQLAVDPAAATPIVVNISGSTTDQALFDRLTTGFAGIVGIDTINTEGLLLEESGELEDALLALPAIEFASGAATILPQSDAILDQVATLLVDNPTTSLEIGGHTDSRGSSESNRALSQARADAVRDALAERGLVNDMVARGFGESRLAVSPDDSAEAQQANRRIEFRVL